MACTLIAGDPQLARGSPLICPRIGGVDRRWLQEELPTSLASRNPPQLSKGELVRLVKWKLSRGKWRPRLEGFAAAADPGAVATATAAMFAELSDDAAKVPGEEAIRRAIKHTSELKVR